MNSFFNLAGTVQPAPDLITVVPLQACLLHGAVCSRPLPSLRGLSASASGDHDDDDHDDHDVRLLRQCVGVGGGGKA